MAQEDSKKSGFADSFLCTYIISVVAASIAEISTYPLDLTKTRLQLQGEIAAAAHENLNVPHRGMLQTAIGIAKEEGILKLWQGVTPALCRHVIYSGIRIQTYEALREKVLLRDPDGTYPLWKSAMGGATAGAVAQFAASPTDLVKVQIQMEGKRRLLGKPPSVIWRKILAFSGCMLNRNHKVRGAVHAFQKIYNKGGIRGLWKGSIPNVQRAALVNLGDLSTYDAAKRTILKHTSLPDNYLTHMMASVCAGFSAAVLGTPADVIKTRVMNQPTDEAGKGLVYKSSLDCLIKTVNNEGVGALYKGFFPIWIRLAPWALTFWVSFEHLRQSLGAATF